MLALGTDIGSTLDSMYTSIGKRLQGETDRTLAVEPFRGQALSRIDEGEQTVTIQIHQDVPQPAVNHVLGVALQHVRQELDGYPRVLPGSREVTGIPLVRMALRELVMAPEAETHLQDLEIDGEWERDQRLNGLLRLLNRADPQYWDAFGSPEHAFSAIQYARICQDHRSDGLTPWVRSRFERELPHAATCGAVIARDVSSIGWGDPDSCLESLNAARDQLRLDAYVTIASGGPASAAG